MTTPEIVTVALDQRSYDIVIGTDLLGQAGARIGPLLSGPRPILITDTNVARHHLTAVLDSFAAENINPSVIELEPGEHTKGFDRFTLLIDTILDQVPERSTTLIALGGGVVGDIVGFAASIILRGIDFIQIPTTILAQVDSSVGGKTGINTRHGKNLVGTFYQPRLVLADTRALDTLPRRQILAGYAEIVKYGLLGDADFFEWLEGHGEAMIAGDQDARRYAVTFCCQAKAAIVVQDERETGKRALLNLGHTFAHALEAETGYGDTLLHGEAVAIGMVMAFDLSAKTGLCDPEEAARVRAHLDLVGLPTGIRNIAGPHWTSEKLLHHMRQDKKVRDGRITFILANAIGDAFITSDIDLSAVSALLENAISA
jgi:3-dehydroquinate synthase